MKKLFLFLMLLPIIVSGQQFEAGVNYGSAFSATASARLFNHLKAGLGYEDANFRYKAVLGSDGKIKLSMPFCFFEYYHAVRKHEFYYGIDIGRLGVTTTPDVTGIASTGHFLGYGAHAGYSRKIIKELYGNVQIGFLYYHSVIENNYVSFTSTSTTTGYFFPATIGLHYVIKPFEKKHVAAKQDSDIK